MLMVMKNAIMITVCSIFSFLSCSPNQIKNDIYLYGTKEFENKVEQLNVSLEQAAILASEYYFTHLHPDVLEYFFTLHIICGNNYIFTTVLHNPKQLKYNLTGIWIDGITGEANYIETKKWTNVDLSQFPVDTYIMRLKNEKIKNQ
jgi:hypothetical protein